MEDLIINLSDDNWWRIAMLLQIASFIGILIFFSRTLALLMCTSYFIGRLGAFVLAVNHQDISAGHLVLISLGISLGMLILLSVLLSFFQKKVTTH